MADLSPQLKQAMPVLVARGEGVYLFDEESACCSPAARSAMSSGMIPALVVSGEQVDQAVEIWTKTVSAAEGGG
jgi:hypothetical protein